jgi:hypothetical protein
MSTDETQIPTEPVKKRRAILRPAVLIPVGVVLAVLLVLELTYFQFHKKFIDDKVDEAVPEGFVPVAEPAPQPTTEEPATTVAPVTTQAAPGASAPVVTAPPATTVAAPPDTPAPSGPMVTEFISRSHGTSGTAYFLQDADGNLVLRIEDLDTDNGPDLKVYLSTNTPDGDEGGFDEDFVNLGKLKGNIGDQNYEVPAGTDVSRFASVVIWCDRFDVAFGAAPAPSV